MEFILLLSLFFFPLSKMDSAELMVYEFVILLFISIRVFIICIAECVWMKISVKL